MTGRARPLRWTWTDSWRLVFRAYFWLVVATTPVMTVLSVIVPQLGALTSGTTSSPVRLGDLLAGLGSVLLWTVMMAFVVGLAALGGAIVSVPFTQVLGLAMEGVRPAWAHVTATALLAGTLGALSVGFWLGPLVAVPLSVATGAAGAIARSEEFRPAGLRARARADRDRNDPVLDSLAVRPDDRR